MEWTILLLAPWQSASSEIFVSELTWGLTAALLKDLRPPNEENR